MKIRNWIIIALLTPFLAVSLAYAQPTIILPRDFPAELYLKWKDFKTPGKLCGPDLDNNGQPDFCILYLYDLETSLTETQGILFLTPGRLVWAAVKKKGGRWQIEWLDPRAPDAWVRWLKERIGIHEGDRHQDNTTLSHLAMPIPSIYRWLVTTFK